VSVRAEHVSETVEYKQGDTVLEGYAVYDNATQGKRPGVQVVHQWQGLGAYEKKRAEMLAGLGLNVFAVDISGKGIRPDNPKDAGSDNSKRAAYNERAD
jgi:dienelactone hydrolase